MSTHVFNRTICAKRARTLAYLTIPMAMTAACGDDTAAGGGGASSTQASVASSTQAATNSSTQTAVGSTIDTVSSNVSSTTGTEASSSSGMAARATLTVNQVQVQGLSSSQLQSGKMFVGMQVTLANVDVANGLPQSYSSFSLNLASNIALAPTYGGSIELDEYCSPTVTINPGGMASCQLVFEVPVDDAPVSVEYEEPLEMVRATGPVPAIPPPDQVCVEYCDHTVEASATAGCPSVEAECLASCAANINEFPTCQYTRANIYTCLGQLTASQGVCSNNRFLWNGSFCPDEIAAAQDCD